MQSVIVYKCENLGKSKDVLLRTAIYIIFSSTLWEYAIWILFGIKLGFIFNSHWCVTNLQSMKSDLPQSLLQCVKTVPVWNIVVGNVWVPCQSRQKVFAQLKIVTNHNLFQIAREHFTQMFNLQKLGKLKPCLPIIFNGWLTTWNCVDCMFEAV